MSKIAIIDTAIDAKYIDGKDIEFYDLCGSSGIKNKNAISHGTLCAMVLDHCTSDYELINIRIFEIDGGKVFGEIEMLAKALELCCELSIDIVSLSAVSSVLSDSKHLYDVTLNLARKAVIISSLDNADYITVPTSYPHVLGVRSDITRMLSPGELAYCADDPFFANIYANCDFPFLREIGHGPSNSVAVPVVAAYVNRLINRGHPKDRVISMINELEPYPISERFENCCKPAFKSSEIPVILLSDHTNETCRAIMDSLFINHEVQSAALSMVKGDYDVRVKETSGTDNIENDLNFVKSRYKTDIIFIVGNSQLRENVKHRIDIDVELLNRDERTTILYDGVCENKLTADVAERLYDILRS